MATGDHAWWLDVLEKRLAARKQDRPDRLGIVTLANYAANRPRPPRGADKAAEAWLAFQAMARTNYSLPVISAVIDRLRTTSFYTASASDDNGDTEAWRFWRANDMSARELVLYRLAGTMRDGYAMVNDPAHAGHGEAVVTIEDPRWTITDEDPLTGLARAGTKIVHDETMRTSTAWVMVAGKAGAACEVRRFTREWKDAGVQGFGGWREDEEGSNKLPFGDVPIVRYTCDPDASGEGTAEHELGIDIIDRINSGILLRLVIAFNQAFRRTALKKTETADALDTGTELIDPDDPDSGVVEVPIDRVFENSPAAMWDLPPGWDIWESAVTDLGPLLQAETKDLQHLAAVTRTPMDYLVPDGANQSAEGASLKRENLIARVEQRQAVYGRANARLVRLAFLWKGDTERANLVEIDPQWRPAQQPSLAERSAAAVQQKGAGVPWATLMRSVLQYTPTDVARMETERDADLLYAEQAAPATAASAPAPTQAAAPAAPAVPAGA